MSHWLSDQGGGRRTKPGVGEQQWQHSTSLPTTEAVPLSLSLSQPLDGNWRVIKCVQPSPVQSDQLYCAKLLRLSDNLSWRGEGGEETPVSRGRIFMFNLNNWDLSWCVACARVRSWHFIIWISAQLDTINYPDLCHATKVHRLRFMITNLSVILKTTHCRLRTANIPRYHNIKEQHEFLFWSILESENNYKNLKNNVYK